MLNSASPLLYIFVTALVTENLVFARAIGASDYLEHARTTKSIYQYGLMLLCVSLPALIITWTCRHYFGEHTLYGQFRYLIAIIALAASFALIKTALTYAGVQNKWGIQDEFLLTVSFNTTALAVVLFALSINANFVRSVVFALGSTLGLTIAVLLIHSGKERLEISNVRKSFQGFPISLIYLGILSMAIYGLIGHTLLT